MVQTVLVAGHLCLDVTPQLPNLPGLLPGRLYEVGPATVALGGCVANTARALQLAGVPTRVAATVGEDALGSLVRELLIERQIDPAGVTSTPAAATSYSIVVQPAGQDRTFWHHAGANATFTGAGLDLDGVDVLHLGYPPLLPAMLTDDAEPLVALLRTARDRGITTSLDLVVVDPHSASARFDWRRILDRVLPYVDIATPSIDDLTSALAMPTEADDAQVERCAQDLLDHGCAVAAVSAGARGAFVTSASITRLTSGGTLLAAVASRWSSVREWVAAIPPERVVSTNGAGDAASAGLLYGLLTGVDLRGAAHLAARFATASIAGRQLIR